MLKRFGLGFAVGYVLGARAGNERYEKLVSNGSRLADKLGVSDAMRDLPSTVREAFDEVREVAKQRTSAALSSSSEDDSTDEDSDSNGPAEEDQVDSGTRRGSGDSSRSGRTDSRSRQASGGRDRGRKTAKKRSLATSVAEIASAAAERGRVA